MYIFLLRHGETDWNLEGRLQGREDVPLNANGLRQAEECARGLTGLKIQKAAASPLQRAQVTCKTIANHLGVQEIETEPGLLERDFGGYSGQKMENIFQAFTGNGTEDLSDAADRIEDALLHLSRDMEGNLLCVSHGAVINALLYKLTNGKTGTGLIKLKNTCVNILEPAGGGLRVLKWNLTAEETMKELTQKEETR